MDGFNHQDWKPIVLTKTKTAAEKKKSQGTTVVKASPNNQNNGTEKDVLRKLEEDEEFRPKVVTREIAQQIIQARLSKTWNQEQLAHASQIPITTIKAYENPTSTTTLNQQFINKISKATGVVIKTSNKK